MLEVNLNVRLHSSESGGWIRFILLGIFVALGLGISPVIAQTTFSDGFETGNLSAWTTGSGTYSPVVTNVSPATGGYSLSLTGGGSAYFDGISRTLAASTPTYIGFYAKTSSTAALSGYFFVGDANIKSNYGLMNFIFARTGEMLVSDGWTNFSGGTYSANTWYRIEFKNIDWTARKYDFYVNGQLKHSGIKFRAPSSTAITQIQLGNYDNAQSGFDDIQIGAADSSPIPLAAPQSFALALVGNQLTLSWQSVSGATGYLLNYGTQSGSYLASLPLAASLNLVGPVDVSSLTPGTYYFMLNAVAGTATGNASTELAWTWSGSSTEVPAGFQAGTPQSYTLLAGVGITEPVTGATLTGPANATGTLTVRVIDSAPWRALGGKPILLNGGGLEYVDVAVAHEPGVNPLVRLWGPHKADGPSASSTSTWRYVLPHSDDGVTAVFRIALSQSAMVSTRAVGRRVDGYGVAIEIPTKEELAALKGSIGAQQAALKAEIETVLNDLIARLPATTAALVRQRMTELPATIIAGISGSTCKDEEGSAYVPYFETYAGYFRLSKRGYLEFCGLADKAVAYHEIGHYLHHLIAGDANYQRLARGSANYGESHIIGQPFNRSALIEDYAYLFEMLARQGKQSFYEEGPGFTGPFSKAYTANLARTQRDYPAMEGFFATLVGALTYAPGGTERSVMLPYQLDGIGQFQRETVPVIGVGWEPVMDFVVAPGIASTDALWILISQAGAPIAVLAERFGWSYYGHGKILDQNGNGVAGASVEPTCKVGISRYVTPSATTTSDGSFALTRIFPGKDCVLVVTGPDGTASDWARPMDATQATSLNIDLGSFAITVPVTSSGPTILGLSAASAPIGTVLTISGRGFGALQGSVAFKDGSAKYVSAGGKVTSWSDTSIVVTVPSKALYPSYYKNGLIVVTEGTTWKVSNAMPFTVSGVQYYSCNDIEYGGVCYEYFGPPSCSATASACPSGGTVWSHYSATYPVTVYKYLK